MTDKIRRKDREITDKKLIEEFLSSQKIITRDILNGRLLAS